MAAQIHGWQGATADLDVAVSPDDDNARRLNTALAAVGADPADVTRSKQAAGRAKDLASLSDMRADFERARRTRDGP